MKIKVLMTALFGVITISAFAQKGELSNAQSAYEKYDPIANGNFAIAKPFLADAKTISSLRKVRIGSEKISIRFHQPRRRISLMPC